TNNCNTTLNSNMAVTATFNIVPPTLSLMVTKLGTGTGQVTCNGVPCNSTYPAGTNLTIIATPTATSLFSGWGSDCAYAASSSTCKLTLNANSMIVATFNRPILDVVVAGTGTV